MGATVSLATSNLFAFPVVLYGFYFNYFSNLFGKMKTDLKNYYWSNSSTQTSNEFDPASLSKCPCGNSADIYNLAGNTLKNKMVHSYTPQNGLTPGKNGILYHNEKPTGTLKNGIRPNYCYTPKMQEVLPNSANMIKTQKTHNNYTRCPDRAELSNNNNSRQHQSRFMERLMQNISETVRRLSWWKSGYFHENPYSFNSTFVNQNRCHRERLPYAYPIDSYNRTQNYMPIYDNPRCPPRRDPSLFAKTHWFKESANDRPPKAHVVESAATTLGPSSVENDSQSFLEADRPRTVSPVCSTEENKENSPSPSIFAQHTKTSAQQPHHHHHQEEEIMISDPEESPTNYDVVFFHPPGMLSGDPTVNMCQILENGLSREDVQNGLLESDDDDDNYELVLTDCSVITYSFSEECEDEFCKDDNELDIFSEDEDEDEDDDGEESDFEYLDRCPSPLPPFHNHCSSFCKPESNYSTDDDDDDNSASSDDDDLEVDGDGSCLPHEDAPVLKRPDSRCCLSNNGFLISPDDSDAISQDGDEDDDDWDNKWSATSPPVVGLGDSSEDGEGQSCRLDTCADRSFNPFFCASLFVSSPRSAPALSTADSDDEEQSRKNLDKLKDVNERWNKAYDCDDDDCDDDRHSSLQNEAGNNHKKVTFATGKNLQTLHLLVCWPFAYQSARKGTWRLDSMRFHDRIDRMQSIIDPVLDPAHRQKVLNLQAAGESM